MIVQKSTYSTRKIELPEPSFIVLYNGLEDDVANEILHLSDLFPHLQGQPNLDLRVRKVNINLGKNDDLLHGCKPLEDYIFYVTKVRTYAKFMDLGLAVERAVNESIKEGILTEFLTKCKAEAIEMSIFEYDEEI